MKPNRLALFLIVLVILALACSLGTPSVNRTFEPDSGLAGAGTTNKETPQSPTTEFITVDLNASSGDYPDDLPEHLMYSGIAGYPASFCVEYNDPQQGIPWSEAREESSLYGSYSWCFCDLDQGLPEDRAATLTSPSGEVISLPEEYDGSCAWYKYDLNTSWQYGVYTLDVTMEDWSYQHSFMPIIGFVFDVFQPDELVRLVFFTLPSGMIIGDLNYVSEMIVNADQQGVVRIPADSVSDISVIVAVGRQSGPYYLSRPMLETRIMTYPIKGTDVVVDSDYSRFNFNAP